MSDQPIQPSPVDTIPQAQVRDLAARGFEVWQMQIPGTIHLRTMVPNRFGQLVEDTLTVGPNRVGHQFRISHEDREDNQQHVADSAYDPFRNGILARIDVDQQTVPETASINALTTEQILEIFDLTQDTFEEEIKRYAEIPLRRMIDVGERMDVSHRKIDAISRLVDERYSVAKSQPSMTSGKAERLR